VPLKFTVIEPFRKLTDWLTKGTIRLPSDDVESLFTAAIKNPTVDARTKASLFSLLSVYYANVQKNFQNAVMFAIAATEEAPEQPPFHLSLADLAIVLKNFDLARKELTAARKADSLDRFSLQIAALKEKLHNRNE
ncbi:MAG: tetratricopeptide repeat protein, partial [Rhodothermales bacterium]